MIDSSRSASDNLIMLEGRCAKCGTRQIGWALHFQRYQACPKCGTGLDIYENGRFVGKGYSPFTAEQLIVDVPRPVPTEEETPASDSKP